ncbi:MAG: lamin tail domain-containing protein, partial [Parcubacteria group bacterium]|nr:lamin tail domain-containing protein [Parcubacteria group bacterium]
MGTATSSNDEWMELYNTTNQAVDLTGWILKSETDDSPNIVLSGTINSFGFYLIERTDDNTVIDITADFKGSFGTGGLKNTGEKLVLKDGSGNVQDVVDGSSAWFDKGTTSPDYKSMERINPRQSGNNAANWATNNGITKNGQDAAGNPLNGTPKAKNSSYVASKPSAVANLFATINSPLNITWTAPEDLDTLPASLSYDLRYSSDDFSDNESIWNAATVVAGSSLPSVGEKGASQSASFDVVHEYGQTIYFALKTKLKNCGSGDCEESDISNIAEVNYPTAINANSWAMLGKDQYHTSFAGNLTGPGVGATVSWEFDAGAGNTVGQPVADGNGNIYFGSANGSGKLIKLDKNGVKQWEYATDISIGTPAVLSDETVYFGQIGAGGVLAFTALNPDGSKKWDYDDASSVKAVTVSSKGEPHFTYSSGSDKLAVLKTDGSAKTTVSNPGLNGFMPVILENGDIITARRVSGNQFFTKYSADGTQLWDLAYTGANGSLQSNPSYDQTTGKTYSAVGHDGGSSFGFRLFAIPSDGSVLNTTIIDPVSNGSGATMVSITSAKLLVGLDYSWSNPASGSKLFSLNKSDLSQNWSFQAEGKINKQIAVDKDGNAYFSTQSGHIYSVDPDGQERWHISVGIGSDISPVLTENGIIWGFGD